LLEQIGLERERVRMYNMSSAMAGEFARAAIEMVDHIAQLGPNRLSTIEQQRENDAGAKELPSIATTPDPANLE
jgi:hypothetical protein